MTEAAKSSFSSTEAGQLKQLIIIGNGFDLECELKTKYADFFNHRFVDLFESVEAEESREPTMGSGIDTTFRFNYLNNKPYPDSPEIVYAIDSLWDVVFCYLFHHKKKLDTWKDVESSIRDFISSSDGEITFSRFLDKYSETIKEKTQYQAKIANGIPYKGYNGWNRSFDYEPLPANRSYADYEYLLILSRIAEGTYEDRLRRLADGYYDYRISDDSGSTIEGKRYDIKKIREVLLDIVLEELKIFEGNFYEYVSGEVSAKSDEYIRKAANLYKQISRTGPDGEDLIDADGGGRGLIDAIVTFIYTSPFDVFDAEDRKNIKCVSHVHGKICEENENKEIIFGIDPLQNTVEDTYKFTKAYRRMECSSFERYKMDSEGMTLGEFLGEGQKVDYIKIYGHSIGEADYSYFQSIFDAVDLYGGSTRLCFFGKKQASEDDTASEIKVGPIFDLIKRYSETLSDKTKGDNLLNKLIFENRLIIANLPRSCDSPPQQESET